jgi:HlyD family secretion protein
MSRLLRFAVALAVVLAAASIWFPRGTARPAQSAVGQPALSAPSSNRPASSPVPATRPTAIRLAGTTEAARARTVLVPRLAGQNTPTLVITYLVKAGAAVKPGDRLVEFDRQEQQRIARDRQTELIDLDGQLLRKRSDQSMARARDETARISAAHDVDRARLDLLKNRFLSRLEAERNELALEQAIARLKQLDETFALKRKAEEADYKILEIRRNRSDRARRYAEDNAKLMEVRAGFAGVVVLKSVTRGSTQSEIMEGDEVRPGVPLLDVIDPAAMQVRTRVNQADALFVTAGQSAKVRLDAYPDLVFDGQVIFIAPMGVMSQIAAKVRLFTAVVSIQGTHPRLMPDLSAAVDLTVPPSRPNPNLGGK